MTYRSKQVYTTRKSLPIILLMFVLGALTVSSLGWILNHHEPEISESSSTTIIKDSAWKILIDGLVPRPQNLTLGELVVMPRSTVNTELYCVGSPKYPLTKGNWTGVRLGLLLLRIGVSREAVKVAFYAEDGHTTDLTVATAFHENIILAYEKDGKTLPEKVRLVVPGKWGYKWISQITHIELVDYDFKGYYESQGYSDEADIRS